MDFWGARYCQGTNLPNESNNSISIASINWYGCIRDIDLILANLLQKTWKPRFGEYGYWNWPTFMCTGGNLRAGGVGGSMGSPWGNLGTL